MNEDSDREDVLVKTAKDTGVSHMTVSRARQYRELTKRNDVLTKTSKSVGVGQGKRTDLELSAEVAHSDERDDVLTKTSKFSNILISSFI